MQSSPWVHCVRYEAKKTIQLDTRSTFTRRCTICVAPSFPGVPAGFLLLDRTRFSLEPRLHSAMSATILESHTHLRFPKGSVPSVRVGIMVCCVTLKDKSFRSLLSQAGMASGPPHPHVSPRFRASSVIGAQSWRSYPGIFMILMIFVF